MLFEAMEIARDDTRIIERSYLEGGRKKGPRLRSVPSGPFVPPLLAHTTLRPC